MDRATIEHSVDCAKWTFAHMRAHQGGPPQCRLLHCVMEDPVGKKFKSVFGNRYLQFENVRTAAIASNFALIQIGYFRNENLVADRIVSDKDRKRFIAWAIDLLRSRRALDGHGIMEKEQLLKAWDEIPESQRLNSRFAIFG
jgi:hypothetical protein